MAFPGRMITYKGKTQNVAAWSEETGLSKQLISYRLNAGWKTEHVLFVQPRPMPPLPGRPRKQKTPRGSRELSK